MTQEYSLCFLKEFDQPELADKILVVRESSNNSRPIDGNNESPKKATVKYGKTNQDIECDIPSKKTKLDYSEEKEAGSQGEGSEMLLSKGYEIILSAGDLNDSPAPEKTKAGPGKENSFVAEDVTKTENKYFVHSFLLSLHSEFFRSLFVRSGMKETNQQEIEIVIGDGESFLFKKFLETLYSPVVLNGLSVANILGIIALSDKYCCDLVIEKCLSVLTARRITDIDDINEGIKAVNLFWRRKRFKESVMKLKKKCKDQLIVLFSPLEAKIGSNGIHTFLRLNFYGLLELLKMPNLKTESENSVLACILAWSVFNRPNASCLGQLLSQVNSQKLSSNFLNDVVTANNAILKKVSTFENWYLDALRYQSFSVVRRKDTKVKPLRKILKSSDEQPSFVSRLEEKKKACEMDLNGNLSRIYIEEKNPFHLCKGYFIKYEIIIRCDGDVSMKLQVPNLIGVKNEIFFKADLELSLHSGSLQERHVKSKLLSENRSVLFKKVNQFEEKIHLKWISPKEAQEVFENGLCSKFSIHII